MSDRQPIRRYAILGRDYTDQDLEDMVAFLRGEDAPPTAQQPDPQPAAEPKPSEPPAARRRRAPKVPGTRARMAR